MLTCENLPVLAVAIKMNEQATFFLMQSCWKVKIQNHFSWCFFRLSGGMRWILILKPRISSERIVYLFPLQQPLVSGLVWKEHHRTLSEGAWQEHLLKHLKCGGGFGSFRQRKLTVKWQLRDLRGNALHARKMRGKRTQTSQSPVRRQ